MIKDLKPDIFIDKISDISLEQLLGANLILFDFDNTLVELETVLSNSKIIDWVSRTSKEIQCLIVSNSQTVLDRRDSLLKIFPNCKIVVNQGLKPFGKIVSYIKNRENFVPEKTVVIGDRLLIDILFGKRLSTKTVLVKPISRNEVFYTKLFRIIERLILSFLFLK